MQSDRKYDAALDDGREPDQGVWTRCTASNPASPSKACCTLHDDARSVAYHVLSAATDDGGLQNYVDAFLLKYTCGEPDCSGTMAPIKGTDRRQCNFCSSTKTEEEFLAEMQSLQQ